ncbi:MAG: DUF4870 domain-containing protein [Sphingobacteriaceae bacterium]|nr:DUF4870 domain-containing protein [Sphingobacteriaceae bacterium]
METTNTTTPTPAQEDKTVAIIAYITLIGFIVAIVMHGSNKTKLGAYHLRQALGLIAFSVCLWVLLMIMMFIPFVGFIFAILSPFIWLGFLALLIIGIINASSGQENHYHLLVTWQLRCLKKLLINP